MGDIELNEGMVVENAVAQMIRAAGHKLYFFSDSDRDSAKDRMEIDFLLAKSRTDRMATYLRLKSRAVSDIPPYRSTSSA